MASDEDSDEDFVNYGTPLEPLEEDEPIRKPIPVHEQTVKDEKGRYQRFHGAFAGGFSAGYFNTVGSKEGWTPSTFVSSRQQKAEKQNARPEDFMDEEDFGEHGIAPQEIVTTSDFASERRDQIKDKARAVNFLAAPIPGDTGLLEELIAPARSSIGVQLLRKMGWKDGQGVGPRLKRKQSKQNLTEKSAGRSYGCALPPNGSEESEDDDDDEFAPENVTFAPKDVIPVDFTPKVDSHGLGYRGLNPLQALSGGSGSGQINLFMLHSDKTTSLIGDKKSGQQRRGGIAGQAFGVGAMEDEDDDIYHKDSMSNYDAVLGGEEPGDGLYGWTAPQQYSKKKNELNRDAAYLGRILEGFTLASKVTAEMKTVYPPPDLPRDYRPVHYFRPVVDSSSVSPIVAQALQASRGYLSQDTPKQGRHTLDSSQRRELLGETSLQGPSSVFELLGSKERERLNEIRRASKEQNRSERDLSSAVDRAAVVASAKAAVLQALSSRFQSAGPQSDSHTQSLTSQSQPQPSSEMQMALNAWSGPTADASKTFKPFANNPQKQARYDLYISRLKQGDRDAVETSLDSSMTEWERGREREEFVRAALLYKPSNSSLSSRFTRAKHEDDTDSVEVTQEQENDVDDQQAAVKMKMFGKLTRETFEWHPDKLLCKRFNVPDPYPGSSTVGMPKVKRDKYSVFNFLTIPENSQVISAPKPPSTALPHTASNKKSRWDVPEQASKPQDPLGALLSEARSEVSMAQQAATRVKSQTDSPNTSEVPSTAPSEEQQSEQKTEKEEEKDEEEEEEEEEVRPPMDLFKAIFASSSDEKSSSSSEDDSAEEEEENTTTSEPSKSSAGRLDPSITIQDTPVPDISKVTDIKHLKTQSVLSATDITEQIAQSSEKAPAKSGDLDEEEFGPRLPPPGLVLPAYSPQSKKQKKKDKEKHKAKKDHKHKKEKKKKKNKKHKHKGKHKKRVEESNSSSDDSDSNSEDESRDVSTSELLLRLKNLRDKRS